MARKAQKKTRLPAEFKERLKTDDLAALQAVFETCDINARDVFLRATRRGVRQRRGRGVGDNRRRSEKEFREGA